MDLDLDLVILGSVVSLSNTCVESSPSETTDAEDDAELFLLEDLLDLDPLFILEGTAFRLFTGVFETEELDLLVFFIFRTGWALNLDWNCFRAALAFLEANVFLSSSESSLTSLFKSEYASAEQLFPIDEEGSTEVFCAG